MHHKRETPNTHNVMNGEGTRPTRRGGAGYTSCDDAAGVVPARADLIVVGEGVGPGGLLDRDGGCDGEECVHSRSGEGRQGREAGKGG